MRDKYLVFLHIFVRPRLHQRQMDVTLSVNFLKTPVQSLFFFQHMLTLVKQGFGGF